MQPILSPAPHEAQIIAFPARPAPAAERASAVRLAAALADLQKALDDQKIAVAAWRESLANLKQSVTQLGGSMADYRQNLTTLATGVTQLNHTATGLIRIFP